MSEIFEIAMVCLFGASWPINVAKSYRVRTAKGGESLCRDGFHMNLIYGRYAVAATWFETLSGKSIFDSSFIPDGADETKIEVIKKVVHDVI